MKIRNKRVHAKLYKYDISYYIYEIENYSVPGQFTKLKYLEEFYEKYIITKRNNE